MTNRVRFYLFLLLAGFCCPAFSQQVYEVGASSESIEPGDESFSVALAGYAGPWAGRFALTWVPRGKTGEHPEIARALALKVPRSNKKTKAVQTVVVNDTLYSLDSRGNITASRSGKLIPLRLPALPGIRSIVAQHHYLYGCTGSDTLYRLHLRNLPNGWTRAAYFNGQIPHVALQRLAVLNNRLYAVNQADSLFEAAKLHGKPEEHLFVRALAVGQKNNKVLLMCLDVCGFNAGFIGEVKKAISQKTGIPAEAVLINASHTHFAPGTQQWLTWAPHNRFPDENYMNRVLRPALVRVAEDAVKKAKPSRLYFGTGTTAIGKNRSNGGLATPYDNAVDVLRTESIDGKDRNVVVLTGCHPVAGTKGIAHFTISSNYPGFLRKSLEKSLQGSTMALFMQGCAGDINPVDEPEVTGEKLASDALKILREETRPVTGGITFRMDSVLAPATPWTVEKLKEFRAENAALGAQMEPERNVAWADLMLKHHKNADMPQHLPVYIQTLNIGDWKLIGLSREVVTEYGLAIKKIWPGKSVSVAGYCNDVASYLPVERHIRTGVYEGVGSCFWYGIPSVFPNDILDRVVGRIKTSNF